MVEMRYEGSPVPVREEIPAADARAWQRLSKPGSWWSGEERVAIAAEVRHARSCTFCRERKQALSPNAVQGEHESLGKLPPAAVEVVHRITTDPARLSRTWYRDVISRGLSPEQYVEIVGIVVTLVSIDSFCRALGAELHPLPDPEPGAPTNRRPSGARDQGAWVPMVPHDALDPEDADLYGGRAAPNVVRAMSLVPDEVRGLRELSGAYYLPLHQVVGDTKAGRSISRPQIELIAGRVSALNECFY